MTHFPSLGLIWLIPNCRALLSTRLGPCRRFTPICSVNGMEASGQHRLVRGGWLTVGRLLRCHPRHPGGLDPVPTVKAQRAGAAFR